MADYKDIIAGTLSKVIDKARDVASAVSDTVNEGGSVRSIYEQGAGRARSYGRIAKLTLEMNGDNEELRRVYAEIGRLCYDQNKDDPQGFYAPLFAQADEIIQRIAAKQQEIQDMKAEYEASKGDIDVEITEFEDIVNATESDGACRCGEDAAPESGDEAKE